MKWDRCSAVITATVNALAFMTDDKSSDGELILVDAVAVITVM